LLVDYFFLKKQRLHLRSIFEAAPNGLYYYSKGFNILALLCVIIGQLTYFMVYNPFTDEAHTLFRFVPASIAAFVFPAVLYWVGMKVWVERSQKNRLAALQASPDRLVQSNV
jgi:NCS1 family nucleobase:cation symporter-1